MRFYVFPQAEEEVKKLTHDLQDIEDQLDGKESQLAEVNLQLEEAEQTSDENERYTSMVRKLGKYLIATTTKRLQLTWLNNTALLNSIPGYHCRLLKLLFCVFVALSFVISFRLRAGI